jgi:hypothetical protein
LANAIDVRRPAHQEYVVAGAIEMSAYATAYRASAKDYESHWLSFYGTRANRRKTNPRLT